MTPSKACTLLFIIGLSVISCRDDNGNTLQPNKRKTTYYLLTPSSGQGLISAYDFTTKRLSSQHFLVPKTSSGSALFHDLAIDDKYIYGLNTTGNILSKINLDEFLVEKSIVFPNDWRYTERDMLRVYNNQLFWTGYNLSVNSMQESWFMKTYDSELNLVDSVSIPLVTNIFDMAIMDGVIFMSVFKEGNVQQSVLALDAGTKELKKEFDIKTCEFVAGETHELIATGYGTYHVLNTLDLNVSQAISRETYVACNYKSSTAVAFGQNTLFYFQFSAQPAPFPFLLQSYNFSTDIITDLTTLDDFSVNPPLLYDAENDVLVATALNKLLILGRDGQKIIEYTFPGEAIHRIFIRYN